MHIIGRGRYARETYPDRGGGSSRGLSGTYLVVVNVISPDPPPPPGDFLFALPNDNTLNPSTTIDVNNVFTFPNACTLTRATLHGKVATIGSANTLGLGGPTAHDFDVYVNGAFVTTLFQLPAGATDVDLDTGPIGVPIPAGAEVQFIVPVESAATGFLQNYLFAFAIGP